MAIYYCNVQVISRGKGRSSIASAAYRSRSKLIDKRTGETHDYRKRGGLSHAEILTPKNAPERFKDRQTLWAAVEQSEKRINSQLSREFVLSLPKELRDKNNVKLVRDYAQEQFVNRGMIADICIHDLDSHNPHAHIMLTMRHIDENGFRTEKKSAREWNKKDLLLEQRAAWSEHVNRALEQANIQEYVDHRSYEERGINREGTVHLGWYAHNLEKQGIKTELGDLNRDIEADNETRARLEKEIKELEAKVAELKRQQAVEEKAKAQKAQETQFQEIRFNEQNIPNVKKAVTGIKATLSTTNPDAYKQKKATKQKRKLKTEKELESQEKRQKEYEKNSQKLQQETREFQASLKELEKTMKQFGYNTDPEKSQKKEQEKIREQEIKKKKDRGIGY